MVPSVAFGRLADAPSAAILIPRRDPETVLEVDADTLPLPIAVAGWLRATGATNFAWSLSWLRLFRLGGRAPRGRSHFRPRRGFGLIHRAGALDPGGFHLMTLEAIH